MPVADAGNAVLGFGRWTPEFSFSAGGGAWSALYPPSNLNALPLYLVGRTTSAQPGATRCTATCPQRVPVRLLGLVHHNASVNGRFRLSLYADTALATLLHTTGWQEFWPPAFPLGALPFESRNFWTGKYTQKQIANYMWTRPVWLPRTYLIQGLRLEVNDPLNPAGFFEMGLLDIAQGHQLQINFAPGSEFGFRFRTEEQEALGGVAYPERRDKPRVFRGTVENADHLREVMPFFWEALREHDLDVPMLWHPYPEQRTLWMRTCFLARLRDPGLIAHATAETDRLPILLEEVL